MSDDSDATIVVLPRVGMNGRRGYAALALVGVFGLLRNTSAVRPPLAAAGTSARADSLLRNRTDHRYRIIGKIRPFMFWIGSDDVGGARLTWRVGDGRNSMSVLIGSEPARAPRRLNEWGYIREEVAGDSTSIFGIRSVTDGDSPADADARRSRPGKAAEFGILCSRVMQAKANSRTTTVSVGGDATYRDVARVVDAAEGKTNWKARDIGRPPDVAPGFLTALDMMLHAVAVLPHGRDEKTLPRYSYVYNDAVYDLAPSRLESVPQLATRSGIVRNLLRTLVSVRNRATGWTSAFSITDGVDGPLAGVPVAIEYQPNWWLKVELELDDTGEVPPDPADDASTSERMFAMCDAALAKPLPNNHR